MQKSNVGTWTTIFFYAGPDIAKQCVLTSDLPRLSSELTYWREIESDVERAKLMKARIGKQLSLK
jgi:hypothetical protein